MSTIPTIPERKTATVVVASGDALDVRQFVVDEKISGLFGVEVVAVSPQANLDFQAIVGREASFTIQTDTQFGARTWRGIATKLEQVSAEPRGLSTYRLLISPKLWLATQRLNYRARQRLSAPDLVVRSLRDDWKIDAAVRLRETHLARKYLVQYAESDYAFFSRLLEDAGVSFYFDFEGEATTLVLSDAVHERAPSPPLRFHDNLSGASHTRERVATALRVCHEVAVAQYTIRDHDYRRAPSFELIGEAQAQVADTEAELERYDYVPGGFLFASEEADATPVAGDRGTFRADAEQGQRLAQKRLEATRGPARTIRFETNAHEVAPGAVTTITGHPRDDVGAGPLLIVQSTLRGAHDTSWTQECVAQSATAPFRPSVLTPRPRALGLESATVVGPAGSEIHTDEFGRVRVHFHWDRYSPMDHTASCWIHVSQSWAGSGFGGVTLPRVGQEVLVGFLGGDPDRPVVVGRVYTALQTVPYPLPAQKTQSGWRSQSTPGGGGYNEIMMEDAAGSELLNIQAQRDLTKLVKNNEDVVVGNNLDELIKNDRTESVGKNKQITIGVNRMAEIGSNDEVRVGVRYQAAITPEGGGGSPTSVTMTDKEIVLDTGAGATIRMKGNEIEIKAEKIEIVARTELLAKTEKGDVKILGGPMVKVNC